jgi:hypothetical protein
LRTLLPVKIEVMELESDHLVTVSPVDTNQVNNADVLADDPLSENEFFSWKEEPPSSSL